MRRQQQDKQRYDTMMMKGHPKRPSASAARDSDYGTDELSSDTMNRMPRSVVNARRAARRGRKNDNSGHSSSYAGSSSDQGNSETILAPWLKIGDRKLEDLSSVTLCDEVMSFGHFMSLTDDEKASRNMIRSTLQELAQAIWPTSTVKIYGSFAYGLSLPNSDIDVVIEDCDTPLQNSFHQFVMHIGQNGYENLGTLDGSGADAFIKARHLKSNLIANVTLTASKSPVRSSVSVIKQQLQTYPAASSVIMVIRTVLSQCNLNDVPSGGLSSFSVIIMLIYLCQLRGDPGITAGTLLKVHFFFLLFCHFEKKKKKYKTKNNNRIFCKYLVTNLI